MTKILLTILFFPCFIYGQSDYIKINGFHDHHIIERIKKESNTEGRFLVYQPPSDSSFSSVLIMQVLNEYSLWVIKEDSVLWKGSLNADKIFGYKNFLKTGAINREDKLKFVPPLISGKETALVIYEDKHRKFYFEYGRNVTGYTPDASFEIYRKEWLNIIRSELNSVLKGNK